MNSKSIVFSALIALMIFLSNDVEAQKRRVLNLPGYNNTQMVHFGFILGINHMLFSVKPVDNLSFIKWNTNQSPDVYGDSLYVYSVTSSPTPGFSVGILANLHLGNYTDLRFIPALSFGERLLNYTILRYKNGEPLFVEIQKSVTSTIIEIPLEFRYRSKRLNNVGAYVLGGAKYSLDLASQQKDIGNTSNSKVKLYRNDFSLEVGVGFEFYTTYFKFGTEAKMGYGLRNILVNEDNLYSGSIDNLHSKVFLLSFTFE